MVCAELGRFSNLVGSSCCWQAAVKIRISVRKVDNRFIESDFG